VINEWPLFVLYSVKVRGLVPYRIPLLITLHELDLLFILYIDKIYNKIIKSNYIL